METLTLRGKRWGSVGTVLLFAPPAVLVLGMSVLSITWGETGHALLFAALGMILLPAVADSLLKAVRPNRMRLSLTGLTLETVYGSKAWSWDEYAGLHGRWHRVLIVRKKSGKRKRIAIGHWQPDLGRALGDYARRAGCEPPPGSDTFITPSPAPLFVTSGVLVLFAVAVFAIGM